MAHISERSPRYRTREQIAEDVAFILKAPVRYGTKYAVLSEVMWVWTEFCGKYRGCRYWSKTALMVYQRDRNKAKLKHEHVVPKKVVIEMLFALDQPTPENVRSILDTFLIGVVLTPEEDAVLNVEFGSKMPPEFYDPSSPDFHNPWLRYTRYPELGLEVVEPTFRPRSSSQRQ